MKDGLPSNVFVGLSLHAAADNIDINEETKSGEGTALILGSVIYQAKRDNEPLLTSGVIANDARIRTVKSLCLMYRMHQTHTKN